MTASSQANPPTATTYITPANDKGRKEVSKEGLVRSFDQIRNTNMDSVSSGASNQGEQTPKRPRIELTPEQRRRIDENRKRALDIQKEKNKNNREATKTYQDPVPVSNNVRLNKEKVAKANEGSIKASIKKSDYIEYDFATMKDTRGGFISLEDAPNPLSANTDSKTLEEWKERQKQQHVVRDLAPPLDISQAPKCYECSSLEIDPNLYLNFNQIRACRSCQKKMPEKYSLLTKTECREDYLLTDPELKDTSILPRIEKPNPHGFSRMQLFLRFQVEEFAWKKWGSTEGLDKEWERREAMRIQRRDKKYNEKITEMRKKTRAEEYTRKLRNGEALGERHVHDWSAPLAVPGDLHTVKRRCIDCGLETEEIIM